MSLGDTMAKMDAIELTADIVAAYVTNNSLPKSELSALLESVHAAVKGLAEGKPPAPPVEAKAPAVSVRKSITPDYLICLDDGKKFKSLKRHLAALGLTADQYRAKWNLPWDYPMVAPNYAAQRSALAKNIGLGRKPGAVPAASVDRIEAIAPEPASAPKRAAKGKTKPDETPPKGAGERKRGRRPKATG